MDFHDIQFPAGLSFGSVGGPGRHTDIVTLANGYEERNTAWAHSRRRYDAGVGMRSLDDIAILLAFFEARRGQLYAFRWKDWADFKSSKPSNDTDVRDQTIGLGDGVTKTWPLSKSYRSGLARYTRPIKKPVLGSVQVALGGDLLQEGPHLEVDFAHGRILFDHAPTEGTEITAGFEFDVPVRFDTDEIQTSVENFQAGTVPHVPVIEVRL